MSKARVLGSAAVLLLAATPAVAGGDDVRVIVGFKGDIDAATVESLGGQTGTVLRRASALSATVSAGAVAALRSDPSVAFVEENSIVEAAAAGGGGGAPRPEQEAKGGGKGKPPPEPPPEQPPEEETWGVSRVGGPRSAAGIKIGIIGTGIDLDHSDLAANIMGDVNIVKPGKSGDDDRGNGTRTAGIIAAVDNEIGVIGIAHDASLYAIKVVGKRGGTSASDLAAGIEWATDNGMNIAFVHGFFDFGFAAALEIACNNAEDGGVLLVAPSGNTGGDDLRYPASYDSVVSVTATDMNDVVTPQSTKNSQVELSGPGVDILTTDDGGGYRTMNEGNQFGGTRAASAHAAGVAAVIWKSQGVTATNASVRLELQANALDLGDPGRDDSYGYGRVQHLH